MPHASSPATTSQRVAIVASQWHADIVQQAITAFIDELAGSGITDVDVIEVPGAFEIPLRVQRLARTGEYAGIAACGFVVNGGIYRHEFVAGSVVDALMRIQLETDVPVFSAVLTPRDFHEHEDHRAFFHAHFVTKGRELAQTVAATIGA